MRWLGGDDEGGSGDDPSSSLWTFDLSILESWRTFSTATHPEWLGVGGLSVTWKTINLKSFKPTLNKSHDHVDLYFLTLFFLIVSFFQRPVHSSIPSTPTAAGSDRNHKVTIGDDERGLEMHLHLEFQVSYFFPFSFCSTNFFTIRLHVRELRQRQRQRTHRHQYEHLDEQGTRDASASRVPGKFFFSFFFLLY
jgi:hypothetical protein